MMALGSVLALALALEVVLGHELADLLVDNTACKDFHTEQDKDCMDMVSMVEQEPVSVGVPGQVSVEGLVEYRPVEEQVVDMDL
jgi:hypothetical protein